MACHLSTLFGCNSMALGSYSGSGFRSLYYQSWGSWGHCRIYCVNFDFKETKFLKISFIYLIFYSLKLFILLFKYSCLLFLPTTAPHPSHPHVPPMIPTPLWFCPCVLYRCSWKPFPIFPPLSPAPYPLVTVSLFLISVSLVIFCWLVCFVD